MDPESDSLREASSEAADSLAWWPLRRLLDARRHAGPRRLMLVFLLLNALSVLAGVLNVTLGWNAIEVALFGLRLHVTFYPALVLSGIAAVWLGPAWGVLPAYLANLASALVGGLPLAVGLPFALAGAIETAILWGSLVTLGLHPDLRRFRDLRLFALSALLAPVAPSLAVLIWNTAHGLGFSEGQRLWRAWMLGDFAQALALLLPLLRFAGPVVRPWIDRQFQSPPRREVASARHAVAVYAALALLGLVVFLGVHMLQRSLHIPESAVTARGEPLLARLHEMQFFLGLLLLVLMTATGTFSTALARIGERQRALARRESLTGCFNRRAFDEIFKREADRCRRLHQGLSLAFLDADHFKDVNDRFGHAAGDRVLQQLAVRVQAAVRDTDVLFRWGGEEFVVLLPHTPPGAAAVIAERVRAAVAAHAFSLPDGHQVSLTVSLGTAGTCAFPVDAQALVDAADTACYAAKLAGRNRVTLTPEPFALPTSRAAGA